MTEYQLPSIYTSVIGSYAWPAWLHSALAAVGRGEYGPDDWKETQQREIHYPTVPAGQYTFEVMAQAPGGSWGPPQEIAIAVDDPWWGTIWFWLLVAAALLLGLWGSWKWRMRFPRLPSDNGLTSFWKGSRSIRTRQSLPTLTCGLHGA